MGRYKPYRNPDAHTSGEREKPQRVWHREGRVRSFNEAGDAPRSAEGDFRRDHGNVRGAARDYQEGPRGVGTSGGVRIGSRSERSLPIDQQTQPRSLRRAIKPMPEELQPLASSQPNSRFERQPVTSTDTMRGFAGRSRTLSFGTQLVTLVGGWLGVIAAVLMIGGVIGLYATNVHQLIADGIALAGETSEVRAVALDAYYDENDLSNDNYVVEYAYPYGDGVQYGTSFGDAVSLAEPPADLPGWIKQVEQEHGPIIHNPIQDNITGFIEKSEYFGVQFDNDDFPRSVASSNDNSHRYDWVKVEYLHDQPWLSGVVDMRTTQMMQISILPMVALVLGIVLFMVVFKRGRRRLKLLRDGLLAPLTVQSRETTSMQLNNQPVYRYMLNYQAGRNTYFARVLSTKAPQQVQDERLQALYDPATPTDNLVLQRLPGVLRETPNGGIRATNAFSVFVSVVLAGLAVVALVFFVQDALGMG